jgi:hypothetical protein
MKMILNVSSHNENDDGGCVLALLDLTPRLAERALRRIESLRAISAQDEAADEIYYWNCDAAFFDPFLASNDDSGPKGQPAVPPDQLFEQLEKAAKDFIEVKAGFKIPEGEIARVDCSQMVVRKEGVAFIAIPKHANFYVETCEVAAEFLRRAEESS